MTAAASHLPNPVIRLVPDVLQVVQDGQYQVCTPVDLPREGISSGGQRRVQHLAKYVELELPGGPVADAHRPRVLVARQRIQFELGEATLAADAVHDL